MRVAIGLGANLGDRLATMREAIRRVAELAPVLARSSVWETAPVGGPPQPDYLNAAVLVAWSGDPIDLLDELMKIEADLGRVREVRDGPRTIDLDVLWIDGRVVEHPRLVVPHPRLATRAFALAPLLEIAPEATDPRTGERFVVPSAPSIRRSDQSL